MKKIAFMICYLLLIAIPAQAAITHNDLLIMARVVGFISHHSSGELNVGIVYAPGVSRSVEEAEDLQAMLGSGLRVGDVFLKPVMVSIEGVNNANVGVFFLTGGVGNSAQKLLAPCREKQIPCITADISQVRNGSCVIGIVSNPKIEILVNRSAAANCNTKFSTPFSMMITEI